jgi:hypothetical protein
MSEAMEERAGLELLVGEEVVDMIDGGKSDAPFLGLLIELMLALVGGEVLEDGPEPITSLFGLPVGELRPLFLPEVLFIDPLHEGRPGALGPQPSGDHADVSDLARIDSRSCLSGLLSLRLSNVPCQHIGGEAVFERLGNRLLSGDVR